MKTTENNPSTEAITLTPAEIEMIRIKREQEELKAKEAETKKQLEREKSIKEIGIRRESFISNVKTQQNATEQFLAELNINAVSHKYELTKTERTEQFILWNYKIEAEDKYEKETYYNEPLTYEIYGLNVVDRNIKIEVKEYFKSTGYSSYSRKQVSQGFRMYFIYENKAIKVVKTIIEKVNDKISSEDRKKVQIQETSTAKELALAELKKRYPEAELTADSKYTSYGHKNGGYTTDLYKVKFPNGFAIRFSYCLEKPTEEKGQVGVALSYNGIESYGTVDTNKMIEALKSL